MADIRDIQDLEERIYDAVQEYVDSPDCYVRGALRVYLDEDDMRYHAVMEDEISGTEDEGVYLAETLVRKDENGELEVDCDRVNDIANEWVFLD